MRARLSALIERIAPYVVAVAAIWGLASPFVVYELLHHTQEQSQSTINTTASQVTEILKAFHCDQRALNGIIQDVPLAFAGDKNKGDYAKVDKMCVVPEVPANR